MIIDKFEEQVEKYPNHIAVKTAKAELTYQELNHFANAVAHEVNDKCDVINKASRETVALLFEHGSDMIVGKFGTLKAAKIYVPLDPSYPPKLLAYMLENSEATLMITNDKNVDLAARLIRESDAKVKIININEIKTVDFLENINPKCGGHEIAYILYTSGSTGRPKGVMQSHRNVLHFAECYRKAIDITPDDRMTLLSSFSHDAGIGDICAALLNGATLCPLDVRSNTSTDEIVNWLKDEAISIWYSVPTLYRYFMNAISGNEDFPSLRFIILGGESVLPNDINLYRRTFSSAKFAIMYGQSESSINSMQIYTADCRIGKRIPLGEAVQETKIVVINENRKKAAPLRIGEIVIISDYIALGYWQDELKSKEVFRDIPGVGRTYSTGDLGRVLLDGSIEFMGRKDFQVKIRGFRIELGGVENHLVELNEVKEAAVIACEDDSGEKYLCAYIVLNEEISASELRCRLSESLPDYMIPPYFVKMEQLPLTPSGKVDRKVLQKPQREMNSEYVAPRNLREEILEQVWSEVLNREKVSIYDDFFELGGHSLKGIDLISKIHERLNVEVSLKEVFRTPTIAGLSEYIKLAPESAYTSIEIAEAKESYEASSAQKRMWLLQQLDYESTSYNMPSVFIIDGNLDQKRLEYVLTDLIERHESLRTTFDVVDDVVVQRVERSVKFELENAEKTETEIEEAIKAFIRPFDLRKAPLLRVGLIKTRANKYYLLFDMHHIISDGVSMSILMKEFMLLYEGHKLAEQRIQYKDFSEWQNEYLKSGRMQEQENYWLEQFSEAIPILDLPLDYIRPPLQSFAGGRVVFKINRDLTEKLNTLAQETSTTLYMVLLSVIKILLSKYTSQEDIIVGSPIAGRPHADLEGIIGMFVNTLAMRNYPKSGKTYEEFLKEVKETALTAYENQDYQFEELVDKLNLRRDLSRNPLFDVMFVLQNMETKELVLEGLRFTEYRSEQVSAKFDLTFTAVEGQDEIRFSIEYCTGLFKRETIERFSIHLQNLIEIITADRNTLLSDIEMLSKDERDKILYKFNDTYVEYPGDKMLHQLFEEQVEKTPRNTALVFGEDSMIYSDLNVKANQLARRLREKGVKPDHIVGVMVQRSFEMIIGILGILKSGGAYMPIAPDYPKERIKFMLEDSETRIILTQSWLSDRIQFSGDKIELDNLKIYQGPAENLELVNSRNDLAYVIYTSGSTGKPKGVMVEHGSVVNLCSDQINRYKMDEYDRVLKVPSISFDASVEQMFVTLLSGAALYLLDKEILLDKLKLNMFLQAEGITHIAAVPSFLENLDLERSNNLKRVIFGGEACPISLVRKLSENFECYNEYGPTEATVTSVIYRVDFRCIGNSTIPIGKPLANYKVYILSQDNKLAPIGVAGELCISGDGLARGYLNRPELTAKKFVLNPLISGERMYRTGDLARWLPDGNIEFLGRIDHQVKVRGFRIELGEIEKQLQEFDTVKEAVVLARESKVNLSVARRKDLLGYEIGDKYLCAYLVAEEEISVSRLRQYLSANLPDHMIPSYFTRLEKMPLTSSGKVDRKALPEPDDKIESKYVAPRNVTEEIMTQIWSELLGKDKVGIYDDFFELGGHSLKATVVISRVHKELNVEVPLKELFKRSTIAGISEYIMSAPESMYTGIEAMVEKEYYEASSAQKRMWLLQQFDQKSTAYNMPSVLFIDGNLDINRIEKVLSDLIERHESLRTTFDTVDEIVVQRVAKSIEFEVEYAEKPEESIEEAIKGFIRPFDLSQAPLLRAGLIKTCINRHYLLFDMHHIISDGTSMTILARDFMALYNGEELKTQRIQYKDFSVWQNEYLKSEKIQKQEQYWLNQFSGQIPLLNLPLDYPRPTVQSFKGGSVEFRLNQELTKELSSLARITSTTLYMVLLSAVNILLSKYTGQVDIIIGSPIAGRPHADLESIIGMFVNTLVMRNYPMSGKSYEEFLKEVKETALSAYENQNYQFEELIDKLNLRRDLSRNPLFDVMFVLQNMEQKEWEIEGLKFIKYNKDQVSAKFDLTFIATEIGEEVLFNIEYCANLFKRETIEHMTGHLQNLIQAITENKEITLGEIDILLAEERNQILHDYNMTFKAIPETTLHSEFIKQAQQTPDKIAIYDALTSITYQKLDERSDKIAGYLQSISVKCGDYVGLKANRSIQTIVNILGILKAGAAYIPIDPEIPESRQNTILNDSSCKLCLEESSEYEKTVSEYNPLIIESSQVAYVIYTSGSTGTPKGVVITHDAACNTILDINAKFSVTANDKIIGLSAISFDLSVYDIFGALSVGASLYMVPSLYDLRYQEKLVRENGITIWNSTPSIMQMYLDETLSRDQGNGNGHVSTTENKLRLIMFSGDWIPLTLARRTKKEFLKAEVISLGGATEASIWSIYYPIGDLSPSWKSVPYGRPLANQTVYILSEQNQLCPFGVEGEICIGGRGLSIGYLNDVDQTVKSYFIHPDYGRLYRTGDRGIMWREGYVEFRGRQDHQIKIRGFRIELGEIEKRLHELNFVKEAIVTVREDDFGDKCLCAYIVAEAEIKPSEFKGLLSKNLPEYMIPTYYVRLDALPLTPNGKVDMKQLPEPTSDEQTEYVAPRSAIEEVLAQIWGEILGYEKVGIYDNFFELGGHSLKGTTLVSRIHQELNIEVPLKELFQTPTIAGISKYMKLAPESAYAMIELVAEKEYYEASSAQKRMWFLQQFDQESIGYNMPSVLILDGNLDKHRLEHVLSSLIERHESLRTAFDRVGDDIVQRVVESVEFRVKYAESKEEQIEDAIKTFIRPFDLSLAPLLRVGLIKTCTEQGEFDRESKKGCPVMRHYLLFDMHHIISDGISMGILTQEFMALYSGEELKVQRIQYKDFSEWQNDYLRSEKMQEQENYWLEQFSDEIPILNLPLDYTRPSVQSFEGRSVEFRLNRELTEELNSLARVAGTSLYMVLLSAISILLSKYTGQVDIIVGSPIAGRPHADLEGIIGMFVNTLAIRSYPTGKKTYVEFLKEIKETALKAYENQDYQFEELIDKLNLRRDISRNPLFDVMFVQQNRLKSELEIEDLKFTEYNSEQVATKFDLTFTATETDDEIVFSIKYGVSLFKCETIKRLAGHLRNLLCTIAEKTTIQLDEIEILSMPERKQLLYEFNDTIGSYPRDKTIHQLFEEQMQKKPDNVALVFDEESMTYSELNAKSNQLARTLREDGVKSDDIIGIMVERSFEMIIGIMGIMKSGGAYLPIDPEYPEERIKFMLEDSGAEILLLQSWLNEKVTFNGKKINLDEARLYEGGVGSLEVVSSSSDLVYVMYTSGSTGRPKGVMIEHRNVANFITGQINKYRINERDRVLQFSPFSFDPSVEQIFTALLSGAALYLIKNDLLYDVFKLGMFMHDNAITHIKAVPTFLEKLDLSRLNHLRRMISGGELCSINLAKRMSKEFESYNVYGPTEATINATAYLIDPDQIGMSVPIGKPLTNYKLYITNINNNKLVPIGVAGELSIGGDGLARGYLNRPHLTAEKFVENPFIPGERMYRTGDLVRWLPDGNIEFLGRIDHQAKIRGFRIELGEIENQLLKLESVNEAVVVVGEDERGDKYLCAYLVLKEEILLDQIRNELSTKLPSYMIPSYFVLLDRMPLTPNGKVDRKAMPAPEGKRSAEYVAPRNRTEEILVQIWSEVLDKERISIYDNFFELGGHSLKAISITSKIHKELNVELQLKDLFRRQTIVGLSECIADLDESVYEAIKVVEVKDHYETSYSQKRMWITSQLNPNSSMFNMLGHVTLYEEVDSTIIQKVFSELIARHEAFRTRFKELATGSLVQIIDEKLEFIVDQINLFVLSVAEREQERKRIHESLATKIFDLRKGHLIDIKLIKINEQEYDLILCMHHIIADGRSMEILKKEFLMLYEAYKHQKECKPTPLRIQYKDFAQWQNGLIRSKSFSESAKAFWLGQLSGELPTLSLPVDYRTNEVHCKMGSAYKAVIAKDIKNKLKELAQEFQTSLFIVLLTTFISFLSELTEQDDILIGMPTLGRGHDDLHHVIGCFINTTILRNKVNLEGKFVELLKTIDKNTLDALEYQDYPLELVIDELNIRYPQLSVLFNMLNFDESANNHLENLNSEHIIKTQDVKFDWEWNVVEYLNSVQIICVYNAGMFKAKTIAYIISSYIDYVRKVSENPDKKLKDYFANERRRVYKRRKV